MTLLVADPVPASARPAENLPASDGALAWFWSGALADLRAAGCEIVAGSAANLLCAAGVEGAPRIVIGAAISAPQSPDAQGRDCIWLLDDTTNLAAVTERELVRAARIYSPLLPQELAWPAHLPPGVQGTLLEKLRFVTGWPVNHTTGPAPFSLSHLAVTEPFPVVVWQATILRPALAPHDLVQLQQAMLAQKAPAGAWLLPPPLNTLELARLQRFVPDGTQLIPCVNFRAGAQEAIRRRVEKSPARATSAPASGTEVVAGPVAFDCHRLTPAEIETRLALVPSTLRGGGKRKPATSTFAAALADWQAGRTLIAPLAHAFIDTGHWRQRGAAITKLRSQLLVESPATPAAFLANAVARLPLRELYHEPSERTRAVASYSRELLDPAVLGDLDAAAPANANLRLLASALSGDEAAFAEAASRTAGSLREFLTGSAVAWLTQRSWRPGPMPALPELASDLPAESLFGAAAALCAWERWDEARGLIELAHRLHPEIFTRPANVGRWNRHLLWAIVCRHWGDDAQAAAALAWVQASDCTAPDQQFLAERPAPARPAGLPTLPRFAAPWRAAAFPTEPLP